MGTPLGVVGSAEQSAAKAPRKEARSRPVRPLPSDRMKFDLQLRILQTLGRMGADKRPVDAERLSEALGKTVSHYTVGLSHAFFIDCGWLEKAGRGDYVATAALVSYSRRLNVGQGDAGAISELQATAVHGWFWPVIAPLIDHGRVPQAEIMVALMREAEVGDQHSPQMRMLLDWLAHLRLITVEDGTVSRAGTAPTHTQPHTGEASAHATAQPRRFHQHSQYSPPGQPGLAVELAEQAASVPAMQDRSPQPKLPRHDGRAVDALLSFDFSFSLSTEDLAKLSPEQIRSLFEAVGAVVALKASTST